MLLKTYCLSPFSIVPNFVNHHINQNNHFDSHNMESPGAVGRRRGNSRSNAEDQALDQIAREVRFVVVFIIIINPKDG